MNGIKGVKTGVIAAAMALALAVAAHGTTLIRMSLEDLVSANSIIVVGKVLGAESRWNEDASFIVTDVRLAATEILKGEPRGTELTITLPGGRVGDEAVLFVGAAELMPGSSYVLFLDETDLPGAPRSLLVRDHVQGAFEIKKGKDGLRAFSQANRQPLMPDRLGQMEPPGGRDGVPFNALVASIRELADRQGGPRREVK